MKVTNAQRMAMEIGSIFGFDVPGADPDFHFTTRDDEDDDDADDEEPMRKGLGIRKAPRPCCARTPTTGYFETHLARQRLVRRINGLTPTTTDRRDGRTGQAQLPQWHSPRRQRILGFWSLASTLLLEGFSV